jgi:hypothetical protein
LFEALQALVPEILEVNRKSDRDRLRYRTLQHNALRTGKLFQALRQNHTGPRERPIRNHDLAEGDSYSYLRADLAHESRIHLAIV